MKYSLRYANIQKRDNVLSNAIYLSFVNIEGAVTANVTDMKPSTFPQDDAVKMTMSEMRLPMQLVSELAEVVYKNRMAIRCLLFSYETIYNDTLICHLQRYPFSRWIVSRKLSS